MNISGLVLHKILSDPTNSLETWAKLKLAFFTHEYISIYSAISKYYTKYGEIPSFSDLDISLRESLLKSNLKALSVLEIPEDISLDVATEALINEYTQSETLKKLELFVDNITCLDTEEIKQEIGDILLYLEEKTHTSEKVCLMSDICIAEEKDLVLSQVPLGINNTFDADVRSSVSELIMLGGARGSGKSIVAVNTYVNQYLNGNVGLYFSIEMDKREVFNRTISMLAQVNHTRLRNGDLTPCEYRKIAKVRSEMFEDSIDLYNKFQETGDYKEFESNLIKEKRLKKDNQLIIVDNQRLTLADIDMNLQKFKAQFGDKLKLAVVDYVNQIEIEDIYAWQQQVLLSKQLKSMARKYEIVMMTPYQIDKTGEARFAKGLLDAADVAMTLEAKEDHISFESTKVRSCADFKIASPIDWESLRISPVDYIPSSDGSENDKEENIPF